MITFIKDLATYGPWVGSAVLLITIGATLTGWITPSSFSELEVNQKIGIALAATGIIPLFCQIHVLVEKTKDKDILKDLDQDMWDQLLSCLKDHRAIYEGMSVEQVDRVYISLVALREKLANVLASAKSGSTVVPVIQEVQGAIRNFDATMAEIDRKIADALRLESGTGEYSTRYKTLYMQAPDRYHFPKGITNIHDIYPPIFGYVFLVALGSLRGKIDLALTEYNNKFALKSDLSLFDTGPRIVTYC